MEVAVVEQQRAHVRGAAAAACRQLAVEKIDSLDGGEVGGVALLEPPEHRPVRPVEGDRLHRPQARRIPHHLASLVPGTLDHDHSLEPQGFRPRQRFGQRDGAL